MTDYYTWQNYRCAYTTHKPAADSELALLLIHPIGVGLSRVFWQRFIRQWLDSSQPYPVYNPDLLGCGDSDKPHIAYYPKDWAQQLHYFIETVVQQPVVLVVQGALFPVAIRLVQSSPQPNLIKGLVLSGPPAWNLITGATNPIGQKLLWNVFFDTPIGRLFYRYARRREFLRSFSAKQLFDNPDDVDQNWLDFLQAGAADTDTRYAVFSFLAGFWRQDWGEAVESISQPTLVVIGEQASSISQSDKDPTPQQRLDSYLQHLPHGQGKLISGRNIPPYESTPEFVKVTAEFVQSLA